MRRFVSSTHPRIGPEALLGIKGKHEALDHRFREVLLECFSEAFGQTVAHLNRSLWLFKQAGHFDDDLGPKTELHHVGRKEDRHRLLTFEAKLRDVLNSFNDALEDLIELALGGLRETPDFDHGHENLLCV